MTLVWATVSTQSRAQSSDLLYFEIAAQKVDQALVQFAQQANISVLFPVSDIGDIQSNALIGHFRTQDALNTLLNGTGLSGTITRQGVFKIEHALAVDAGSPDEKKSRDKKSLLSKVKGLFSRVGSANTSFEDQHDIEEIIVYGFQRSLSQSLEVKRSSNSIVDVISADDIGKFPDTTIADSLQHIAGVQIRRRAGEGATLNVRGINQVGLTLNGEQIAAAGSIITNQPSVEDIPAELLSEVEVLKSPTADMLYAGTSGTLNFKTHRPFDLKEGPTLSGAIERSTGSYSKRQDPKYVAFLGFNHQQKFGAAFTYTGSRVNLANYRAGLVNDDWFSLVPERLTPEDLWGWGESRDANGDGDTDDIYISFQGHTAMNRFTARDRDGISGSLQAQITDKALLTFDLLHTKMSELERTAGFVLSNSWQDETGWWRAEQAQTIEENFHDNGSDLNSVQAFELFGRRFMAYSRVVADMRDALNTSLSLQYDPTPNVSLLFRYIHGDAQNTIRRNFVDAYISDGSQHGASSFIDGDPLPPDVQTALPVNPGGYRGIDFENNLGQVNYSVIPAFVDYRGEFPSWTFPSDVADAVNDMGSYSLTSTYSDGNRNLESTLDTGRIDINLDISAGDFKNLELGMRFSQRGIDAYEYDLVAPVTSMDGREQVTKYIKWKDPTGRFGDTNGDGRINEWDFSRTLTRYPFTDIQGDVVRISDFGPVKINGIQSLYFISPHAQDDPLVFQNRFYPGNVEYKNINESFFIEETTQSFYIKSFFNGELPISNIPYSAELGLQGVQNRLDIRRSSVIGGRVCDKKIEVDGVFYDVESIDSDRLPDKGTEISLRRYSNFLPSAHLSLHLTQDTVLRTSYAETISNVDPADLGRSGTRLTTTPDANDPNIFVPIRGERLGNPNLMPWQATHFNLAYDWYIGEAGFISLGIFNIDIDSFIETSSTQQDNVVQSDCSISNNKVVVTEKSNGEGLSVKGVELNYQQALNHLPSPFDGFGITFSASKVPNPATERSNLDEAGLFFNDSSEEQMSFILWYEKYGWRFRIAQNYRSDRFIRYFVRDSFMDSDSDSDDENDRLGIMEWQDGVRYWDASASYDINRNLTIYAQGTNLREEYERNYIEDISQPSNSNYYERRVSVGLRARF